MYVSLPPYKPQENHKKNNHVNYMYVTYTSSGITHEIECWIYGCLYVFHYILSHCFETIRISDKTHQIKTTLFQFCKKRRNMK